MFVRVAAAASADEASLSLTSGDDQRSVIEVSK